MARLSNRRNAFRNSRTRFFTIKGIARRGRARTWTRRSCCTTTRPARRVTRPHAVITKCLSFLRTTRKKFSMTRAVRPSKIGRNWMPRRSILGNAWIRPADAVTSISIRNLQQICWDRHATIATAIMIIITIASTGIAVVSSAMTSLWPQTSEKIIYEPTNIRIKPISTY